MTKENKKIRNATICKSSGITFKSKLEKDSYKLLQEEGLNPQYEPKKIILIDGFIPTIPFYDKETDNQQKKRVEEGDMIKCKLLKEQSSKILPITYTPDIYIKYNNIDVWIELKGKENDCYYLKKKLFRLYLEKLSKQGIKSMFFEVYSKKQLLQAIKIIRNV